MSKDNKIDLHNFDKELLTRVGRLDMKGKGLLNSIATAYRVYRSVYWDLSLTRIMDRSLSRLLVLWRNQIMVSLSFLFPGEYSAFVPIWSESRNFTRDIMAWEQWVRLTLVNRFNLETIELAQLCYFFNITYWFVATCIVSGRYLYVNPWVWLACHSVQMVRVLRQLNDNFIPDRLEHFKENMYVSNAILLLGNLMSSQVLWLSSAGIIGGTPSFVVYALISFIHEGTDLLRGNKHLPEELRNTTLNYREGMRVFLDKTKRTDHLVWEMMLYNTNKSVLNGMSMKLLSYVERQMTKVLDRRVLRMSGNSYFYLKNHIAPVNELVYKDAVKFFQYKARYFDSLGVSTDERVLPYDRVFENKRMFIYSVFRFVYFIVASLLVFWLLLFAFADWVVYALVNVDILFTPGALVSHKVSLLRGGAVTKHFRSLVIDELVWLCVEPLDEFNSVVNKNLLRWEIVGDFVMDVAPFLFWGYFQDLYLVKFVSNLLSISFVVLVTGRSYYEHVFTSQEEKRRIYWLALPYVAAAMLFNSLQLFF